MKRLSKSERRAFYNSLEWKNFRPLVLERDNYECVWCKEEAKLTTIHDAVLEVDHIKELKDHPELALELSNCRTLCKNCHNKRHKRFNFRKSKKEKKWDDEFDVI